MEQVGFDRIVGSLFHRECRANVYMLQGFSNVEILRGPSLISTGDCI